MLLILPNSSKVVSLLGRESEKSRSSSQRFWLLVSLRASMVAPLANPIKSELRAIKELFCMLKLLRQQYFIIHLRADMQPKVTLTVRTPLFMQLPRRSNSPRRRSESSNTGNPSMPSRINSKEPSTSSPICSTTAPLSRQDSRTTATFALELSKYV